MKSKRKLLVDLKDDDTIAILSLGGGMPVGLYLNAAEAEVIMHGLYTVLFTHRLRMATQEIQAEIDNETSP